MTKIKTIEVVKSYEDVNDTLFRIAKLDAELKKNESDMNKELNEVTQKYEKLSKHLVEEKYGLEATVEEFCIMNKKDFTAKGQTKTKKLTFGIVKFKMNPGAIALLKKIKDGFTKAASDLNMMFGGKYIRVKYELNKENILEDYRAGKIGDMELASVNLRVDKEDKFSYSINWKEIEKKEKEKAA